MSSLAPADIFPIGNVVAIVGWILLATAPVHRRPWRNLVLAIPVALALLYAVLIGVFWAASQGSFGSLAAVAQLFENRGVLLAGWVHYLAFDLLIGLWERDEAQRLGLPRSLLMPCLAVTFWFGPLGWLVFLIVRGMRERGSTPAIDQPA